MYSLAIQNEYGELLNLTGNSAYTVLTVTGTNPPPATINTANIAGVDGTRFNSSKMNQRNIVIKLNIEQPIEQNRLALYRFIRVKRKLRIFYKNSDRDVYIDGYVESIENNPWSRKQQPQISIICPRPYWLSQSETSVDFAETNAMFAFPFSIADGGIPFSGVNIVTDTIINGGEIDTGGIIKIKATSNQIVNPKFYNRTTQTFFGVDVEMQSGDIITIDTQIGEKSVTLTRSGTTTNILYQMASGSTWVQFAPGVNQISYDADEGAANLEVSVTLIQKYEGV